MLTIKAEIIDIRYPTRPMQAILSIKEVGPDATWPYRVYLEVDGPMWGRETSGAATLEEAFAKYEMWYEMYCVHSGTWNRTRAMGKEDRYQEQWGRWTDNIVRYQKWKQQLGNEPLEVTYSFTFN